MPYDNSAQSASRSPVCDAVAHVGTGCLTIDDPAGRALRRVIHAMTEPAALPAPVNDPVPDPYGLCLLVAAYESASGKWEPDPHVHFGKRVSADLKSTTAAGQALNFIARERHIADLRALFDLLIKAARQPNVLLIRGALRDGTRADGVLRRLHPREGEPATFRPAARHHLQLDLDSIPLPPGVQATNVPACIAAVRAVLPPEFRVADCIVQISGSHGIKPGIRVRLWFELSRPLHCAEARGWLQNAPVDQGAFGPVQPIYVTPPIYPAGHPDPWPCRFFWHDGTQRVVEVPADLPPAASNVVRIAGQRAVRTHTAGSGGSRAAHPRPLARIMLALPNDGWCDGRATWTGLAHAVAASFAAVTAADIGAKAPEAGGKSVDVGYKLWQRFNERWCDAAGNPKAQTYHKENGTDTKELEYDYVWHTLGDSHTAGPDTIITHARACVARGQSAGRDVATLAAAVKAYDDVVCAAAINTAQSEFPATEDAPTEDAPAEDAPQAAAASPGARQVVVAKEAAGTAGRDSQGDEVLKEVLKEILGGKAPEGADLTEDGVALRFAARYADILRYVKASGTWYGWVRTHWKRDEKGAVLNLSRTMCRAMLHATGELKFGDLRFGCNVEKSAGVDPRLATTMDIWDRHPMLLATPGGTVDLTTGELREARPDEYLNRLASVAPSPPGAPHPAWDRFLAEATGEDAALIHYLHVAGGYFLTGDTCEHALFFLYGKGGNGKGVFLTVLQEILGDYAQQAEKDTFNESRGNRHTADLAAMVGKRLVAVDETEKGEAWKESLIKAVTGGGKIRAHFMGKDYFEFTPMFKLLVVGNHKPVLKAVNDAIRRRLHLIPFTRKPRKADLFLLDKLRPEYPAILRSLIDGCLTWQREGLVKPAVVDEATSAYLSEQDGFARWLEACCDIDDPVAFTTTDELLSSVRGFGMGQMSDEELADELKARGFIPGRKFHDGKQRRGYSGIRVVDGTFKL